MSLRTKEKLEQMSNFVYILFEGLEGEGKPLTLFKDSSIIRQYLKKEGFDLHNQRCYGTPTLIYRGGKAHHIERVDTSSWGKTHEDIAKELEISCFPESREELKSPGYMEVV
jgi:hypothetical protein